jgi:glyoxylase-like metal-dependent hydrolase (beta-lactamase superfamily II)
VIRARTAAIGWVGVGVSVAALWLATARVPLQPIPDRADLGHNVTLVREGNVAVLVFDTNDGILLVDAGADPHAEAVVSLITDLEYTPDDVHTVLLTHDHPDHIGGLAAFPSAAVMGLPPSTVPLDRELSHHGVVRHGTIDIEVYATPGHTAGSASYLLQGIVAVGDAANVSVEGKLVVGVTDDPVVSSRSLTSLADRMQAREVRWVAPSHTGPSLGPDSLDGWATAPR